MKNSYELLDGKALDVWLISGSVASTESYTRDRLGNILTKTTADGLTTLTYDPLYRLLSADYPGTSQDRSYTYDAVGNRLTQTVGGVTQAYVYNAGNRLLEVHAGSTTGPLQLTFTYDNEGRPLQRRDGSNTLLHTYTPDPKNRMAQIKAGTQTVSLYYDPFDQRIQKSGNEYASYLLEGEHVETVRSSHQPAQYFRGVVIDEIVNGYQNDQNGVWTNYTYAHDRQQSVVGLVAPDGTTQQTIQYGPFGEELGGTGASCTVLKFTGREKDAETGLYYYRARYYDPTLGRFLTEDPLGFAAGVNFYAYVNNNPINLNDPTGKLAPIWHYLVSLGAGFSEGMGLDSFSFAYNTAAVDWRTATLNPAADIQNIHGTGGLIQTPSGYIPQTQQQALTGITQALNDPSAPLAQVAHTAQDVGTPGHTPPNVFTGLPNSDNGASGFLSGLGDLISHTLGDWFPSPATLSQAFNNTTTVIQASQNGSQLGVGANGSVFQIPNTQANLGIEAEGALATQSNLASGLAGGGFLLYPNKPNLNMMRSVYSK